MDEPASHNARTDRKDGPGQAMPNRIAAFWHEIYLAMTNFGGDFHQFHEVQTRRREAFRKERDKRPDTWNRLIWDKPKDAVREMLGFLLGEPNATAPSG